MNFETKLYLFIIYNLITGVYPAEVECDFSSITGNLSDAHISICVRKLDSKTNIKIICPDQVEGNINQQMANDDFHKLRNRNMSYEYQDLINMLQRKGINYNEQIKEEEEGIESKKYTTYPENVTEEVNLLISNDLVSETDMKKVGVWEVFGTKKENIMSKNKQRDKEVVILKPPEDEMFTVKKNNPLIYLCIRKKYIEKCDKYFRELMMSYKNNDSVDHYEKIYLPLLDRGNLDIRVGVAIITLDEVKKVEYGCESSETKFFKNSQKYEVDKGINYCKIDVMEKPNLGFYCEGRITPYECMAKLNNADNMGMMWDEEEVFSLMNQRVYMRQIERKTYSYINYDRTLLDKEFEGYCECRDESNRLKAVLVLERKKDHVCDITSMLMKNNFRPIEGEWCNVTLHPGDTLKIIVPQNEDNINLQKGEEMAKIKEKQLKNEKMDASELNMGESALKEDGIIKGKYWNMKGTSRESSMDEEEVIIYDVGELESDNDEDYDSSIEVNDSESTSSEGSDEFYLHSSSAYDTMIRNMNTQIKKSKMYLDNPKYTFVTMFSPKNPRVGVNSKGYNENLVSQMRIDEMFGGLAYKVDTSEMERGIIKIKYEMMPLTTKTGKKSVNYYWALKDRALNRTQIMAKVAVNLAQVDEYTYGCETVYTGLFHPNLDSPYCRYTFNGCKKRKVNHFAYEVTGRNEYGISCNEEESLYPEMRGPYMIDSETNKIERVGEDVKSKEYENLPKYKVFKGAQASGSLFDYRCSCIDKMGREISRLTLYSNSYPSHEFKAYFDERNYVLLLSGVKMFYPKRAFGTDVDDELMNTLPEIEYIVVPRDLPTNKIILEPGTYLKIASGPPKEMDQTIEINPEFEGCIMVHSCYRYKGVRHKRQIGEFGVYTDPYISQWRLFPVNFTKYFYRLQPGKKDKLVPVKYSKIFATNVEGLILKTRNCLGYHLTDYSRMTLSLPKGAIVIIKEENTHSIEMVFASGAISKPEQEREYYEKNRESEEEKMKIRSTRDDGDMTDSVSTSTGSTTANDVMDLTRSMGKCSTGNSDRGQCNSGCTEGSDVGSRGESCTGKTDTERFDWDTGLPNENYGRKDGKSLRLSRRKEKKVDLEEEPKEKRRKRDLRKMEIWGLHSVIINATNPWVKGCGVTDIGEDFFKQETMKIIENENVVGCKVNISKDRIAGFYCPEPYKLDPPECFEKGYTFDSEKEVAELSEMFENREWKNTAFRYIAIPTQLKKKIKMMFRNKKKYVCYCRTIKGVEMSRIEIEI